MISIINLLDTKSCMHRCNRNFILSNKLWYAFFLFMKTDYSSALDITNKILSSIPPFVMCDAINLIRPNNENEQLYVDMFLDSDITVMQRVSRAWMFHMYIMKDMIDLVPLAIQIELYFGDPLVVLQLSPLTCMYYLQFLCYHRMCRYDRRNCALQQLLDLLKGEHTCNPQHALNITGHCLLLAGERAQAWRKFNESYQFTQLHPIMNKYNPALWYLQNCFSYELIWNLHSVCWRLARKF